MGCVGSDFEAELRFGTSSTINRLKLPKKILDECSTVCQAPVPRKLRSSAMKKRSSESISPTLRVSNKLNRVGGRDQLVENDGLMKSKQKMKQVTSEGCVTNCIQEAVTKEEQEVAEALYALSGVFPNSATTDKTDSANGGVGAEIFVHSVDGWKQDDELETVNYGDGKTPNPSSCTEGSAGETARLHLKDTTQSDISVVKQPPEKFDSDMPEVNLHLTAFTAENQHVICDSASGAWTQLNKTRSKLATVEKSQGNYNCQDIVLPKIADASDKNEVQHANTKAKTNGSPSRPDLSSATPCDIQKMGRPFQSHGNKLSSLIESTSGSAKSSTLESNFTDKKGAPFSSHSKNSWKRCSTHVYICNVIKVFQARDGNNRTMMRSSTMNKLPDQRAQGTDIQQSGEGNSLNGVVASTKNAAEVKNAILLHKKLVKDQQQASKAYDVFTAQNPSSGFLSMPAGGGRVENISGIHRAGNSLEASTSVRIPCLQSQNHQVYIPFPGPQNLYSSTSSSALPVAPGLQVQLPPFFGSRSYAPPFTDANAVSVQPQTGVPHIPPFLQPAQTSFPHSLSSLEGFGSRYNPISQQQQLVSATSLLPPSTAKGPYHHLPSVYDANVGRARPDNASLQIICNQYI